MENLKENVSRKGINVEEENLQEKVSKETAHIIKSMVAQDTAYWDLKEKLQQVTGNYERLQQNMVEVQMQYETISGQLQDETHHRSAALNQLSENQEMCQELQNSTNKLKVTLCRCRKVFIALYAKYQKSMPLVENLIQKQQREDDQKQQLIDSLQDKVRVVNEQQAQLLQLFSSITQEVGVLGQLKDKLEAVLGDKGQLASVVVEVKQKIDLCDFDIQKNQETIANLQKEKKELLQEINTRSSDMNNTILKQENELKKVLEANESLKVDIANKEEYTKTVCEQNYIYQEMLTELEEEKAVATATIQGLQDKLQLLLSHKEEINKLKEQIASIDREKCEMIIKLKQSTELLKEKSKNIEELNENKYILNKNLAAVENEHKAIRESFEAQIKDLMQTIEARDKEMGSIEGILTQLMSEIKISTDASSKLETTLQNIKKEEEMRRDNVKKRERTMNDKITKLLNEIQHKEKEMSKNMKIILDMKNENERLQERNQSMQNKIDNLRKKVTASDKPARAPVLLQEIDDNAVMMTPQHEKHKPYSPMRNVPGAYLFSDGSMVGDNTLDDAIFLSQLNTDVNKGRKNKKQTKLITKN